MSTGAPPDVEFARDIRQGTRGKDVVAHKRALSRARPDLYRWAQFNDLAAGDFLDAVVAWKQSVGLDPTRVVGRRAHETLEQTRAKNKPDEWAFDSLAVRLAREYWTQVTTTPEQRVRDAIVEAALFWYGQRDRIAYVQSRPFEFGTPPWVPSKWDCSAFVTACYKAGGAPDPNGRNYDGNGYTGTLMSQGSRVGSIVELKPGDLIFYGSTTTASPAFKVGDPTHVALFVGMQKGVPSVVSNGSHPMGLYRFDYRGINHLRHYQVV
jgi:hypothetical protein